MASSAKEKQTIDWDYPKEGQDMFEKIGNKLENKLGSGKSATTPATPRPDMTRFEKSFDPSQYNIEDGESTYMVNPESRKDPKFIELRDMVIDWINNLITADGMVVNDLEEDLFDGLILQMILLKILPQSDAKYDRYRDYLESLDKVVGSLIQQRQKLDNLVLIINDMLDLEQATWDAQRIHEKDLVAILQLMVALMRFSRAEVRLPVDVSVTLVEVTKQGGQLKHSFLTVPITNSDFEDMMEQADAFDALFETASRDKLEMVKTVLRAFVEKYIQTVYELSDDPLESWMHDGVYLVFLIGFVQNFAVPLHLIHLTPREKKEKVHNVKFAFKLMASCRMKKPKALPESIVEKDLKAILRVLYIIYSHAKNRLPF